MLAADASRRFQELSLVSVAFQRLHHRVDWLFHGEPQYWRSHWCRADRALAFQQTPPSSGAISLSREVESVTAAIHRLADAGAGWATAPDH